MRRTIASWAPRRPDEAWPSWARSSSTSWSTTRRNRRTWRFRSRRVLRGPSCRARSSDPDERRSSRAQSVPPSRPATRQLPNQRLLPVSKTSRGRRPAPIPSAGHRAGPTLPLVLGEDTGQMHAVRKQEVQGATQGRRADAASAVGLEGLSQAIQGVSLTRAVGPAEAKAPGIPVRMQAPRGRVLQQGVAVPEEGLEGLPRGRVRPGLVGRGSGGTGGREHRATQPERRGGIGVRHRAGGDPLCHLIARLWTRRNQRLFPPRRPR